jgi:hypothetical protein
MVITIGRLRAALMLWPFILEAIRVVNSAERTSGDRLVH